MPRHQAAVDRQLMDHLVGRRSQVDRPPIQIQEHRLARDFIVDSREQCLRLQAADGPRRLVGELDLDPAPRRRLFDHLAVSVEVVALRGQFVASRSLRVDAAGVVGDHRLPCRVKIAARRGKRIGPFRAKKSQVVFLIGEPGRDQPRARDRQLEPLCQRTADR